MPEDEVGELDQGENEAQEDIENQEKEEEADEVVEEVPDQDE